MGVKKDQARISCLLFFFKERYLNFHKTLFLHQCKFISLAPVSCNSILSLMSSESKLMHKRNYANKIISNHHCLQKRTTKSCSQKKSIDKDNYIIRLSQSSLHSHINCFQLRIFYQHGIKIWIEVQTGEEKIMQCFIYVNYTS